MQELSLSRSQSTQVQAPWYLRLGTTTRRVTTIPREAVDSGGFAMVWDTGRPVLRQLTVGDQLPGDRIEVVDGLAPGENLFVEGGLLELR